MTIFNIGDMVVRKSHGQDICFTITDIKSDSRSKPVYVLRGIFYRIEADAYEEDLLKEDYRNVQINLRREISKVRQNFFRSNYLNRLFFIHRLRRRPGTILHIDSSQRFLNMCTKLYNEAGIKSTGHIASEKNQPGIIRRALFATKPDILVVTGHDGIRKGNGDLNHVESYRSSKYYIQSVREARRYEPDPDKLCIFAGACQSFYEAIMDAGANFASSPARININALDPAILSERVALTDRRYYVTPEEISQITISGSGGIGGVNTRGRMVLS
ncbi:UNVERIFIED_CONTAM: spore coat assembly protein [Acetivibrio alkalicellulosi]